MQNGNKTSSSQIVTRNQYAKGKRNQPGTSSGIPVRTNKGKEQQQGSQTGTAQQQGNRNVEDWCSDTVYLEPTNIEEKSFKHPAEVGKILAAKGITGYTDIHKIGRYRFKLTCSTVANARKILNCNLEDVGMKPYIPSITKEIIGMAKEVPISFTDQELRENLESEREIVKVERMQRKLNNGQLVPIGSIKVTFKGKEMPRDIVMYGCRFRVELYIFPMKQCHNCWMFGHKQNVCKKPRKCVTCGLNHADQQCEGTKQCINCGKGHQANDKECPERKRQQKVNLAVQHKRITVQEAQDLYPKLSNQYDLLSNDDDFPDLDEDATSQASTSYAWGNRKRRGTRKRKGAGRKNKESTEEAEWSQENEMRTTIEDMAQKVEKLERNLSVIGKVIWLENCIQESMRDEDQVSLESLVIRISTVLKEIIVEFGKNATGSGDITGNENNQQQQNGY